MDTPTNILLLHQWLLTLQHDGSIFAGGIDATTTQLAELLSTKGVNKEDATSRAQQVLAKLGNKQVQTILRNKNPWAELKAAASKPGTMFRLITQEEQSAYIEQRAKTQHGAQVRHHKHKKSCALQYQGTVQSSLILINSNWTVHTSKMILKYQSSNSTSLKLKQTSEGLPFAQLRWLFLF